MTLTIHEKIEQRSEEWFEQRRGIVTASVVGNLITSRRLSAIDFDCPECGAVANAPCLGKRSPTPIKTLHSERAEEARRNSSAPILEVASNDDSRSLTALLVSERITGWSYPTYVSDDMWRGIEHEPIARSLYAAENKAAVSEVGFMVRDDRGVRLGYSPDGLVEQDGLLEIKCPRPKSHMNTIIANVVPAEHMPQLQAGLLVSGRKWIDFVSFCAGMPLFIRRVYPSVEWQRVIVEAVRRFEDNAMELARIYHENATGLAATERIIEQEIVI